MPLLRTARFGRVMHGLDRTPSTNDAAAAWAERGAPEGCVVTAEYQTAGRGRLGRSWEAAAGLNLTFSVVLRPTLSPERLGLVTLAAGVAVTDALAPLVAPLEPQIKWPNDVLLEGRKCCGMLLEGTLQQNGPVLILGIGLNVNQTAFPPALADRATSLLLATGRLVPRAPLLADLLQRLEHGYDALHRDGGARIRQAYLDRLAGLGRPVALRFSEGTGSVHGRIAGITETGALRLETDDGPRTFHAGEVTTDFRSAPV